MMRNERYRDLIPIQRLSESGCSIIGVGAVGRQVALQLAAMGVRRLHLVDFDRVEPVNLGPQAYLEDDVGEYKVEATASMITRLNNDVELSVDTNRFGRSTGAEAIVFVCVDSIQTRRFIWESLHARAAMEYMIDGRMAAEVLRVITVTTPDSRQMYPLTLFRESEALQQPCTARSTVYCANIAAGIMVSQFTQWLRGMPATFDIMLNLLAMELSIEDAHSGTALQLNAS